MTWTYSGDPANSQLDELRFIVQDVYETLPLLENEEMQYLLDTWMPRYDSIVYVGAIAAATISRKFATLVSVSADGVTVNTSDLSDRYAKLAEMLREESKSSMVGGEIDITNVLIGYGYDPSLRPLRFSIGLHDNPGAGIQDYGGLTYDPFLDAASATWVAYP